MYEPILKVEHLDVSISMSLFKTHSARDIFINALTTPFIFFRSKPQKSILQEINFELYKGDRLAIIGVNGSGKTTLCRCIAGLMQPTMGKVLRKILPRTIMQAESGIFPDLSGRENADLISQFLFSDLSKSERNQLVDEALEFAELGIYADVPMENYSLGMKSRLTMSVTTARPHKLLILDEIASHADEFFQTKLQNRVQQLIQKSEAVILVSHNERELLQFCNRGLVLQEGKIKFDGDIQKAIKAYRFLNNFENRVENVI